jgi:hypothetical protein
LRCFFVIPGGAGTRHARRVARPVRVACPASLGRPRCWSLRDMFVSSRTCFVGLGDCVLHLVLLVLVEAPDDHVRRELGVLPAPANRQRGIAGVAFDAVYAAGAWWKLRRERISRGPLARPRGQRKPPSTEPMHEGKTRRARTVSSIGAVQSATVWFSPHEACARPREN